MAEIKRAETAAADRDWEQAASRYAAVAEELGDRTPRMLVARLSQAQLRCGNPERAEATARAGLERFGSHHRLEQRLAEAAAAQRDWPLAERYWRLALESRGDEDASPGVFVNLSWVLRRRGRAHEAKEIMRRASAHHPGVLKVEKEAAEVLSMLGTWSEIAEVWERFVDHFGEEAPPIAYVRLTNARRQLGDLAGAEEAASRGLERYPHVLRLAAALAGIAGARRDWHEASRRWDEIIERAGERALARWHHRHGLALERTGRLQEASAAYDRALDRLQFVDEPWAHEAKLTWRFRRDYVRQCLSPSPHPDPRLDVELELEGEKAPSRAVGWFEAVVTYKGVRISGGVEDAEAERVEVLVDEVPVKSVAVDHSTWPGEVSLHLKHHALAHWPTSSRLMVRCLAGPLVAEHRSQSGQALRLHVPFGDDNLHKLLGRGVTLTKKGTLFDAAAFEGEGARRQMEAYGRLRELFSERLGLELFLMYGTLLGYHRDGAFIKGDDDLDVGYLTDAVDPASAKAHAAEVAHELLRAGFDVTTRFGGGLLKTFIAGVELDVYPVWLYDGRAWAYDAVPATRETFLPARTGLFHGVEVRVPADPEALLEGTYGPGWRTPDPGFRHVRTSDVLHMVRMTYLTPSEARHIEEVNLRDRSSDLSVGRFEVTLDPGPPVSAQDQSAD